VAIEISPVYANADTYDKCRCTLFWEKNPTFSPNFFNAGISINKDLCGNCRWLKTEWMCKKC
jgi:hypothetical protein